MLGGLDQRRVSPRSFGLGYFKTRDIVNVKDPAFGTKGDGITNDVAALRLVNSTKSAGKYKAYFPAGSYLLDDEVQWDQDRINLEGDGQQATVIKFNPSATGKAAFHFKKQAAALINQCSLRGFAFDASGNTVGTKSAIRVTDGEEVILDDFAVSNWSSAAKDCIGLQLRGRQTHSISNYVIFADIPISIEDNPNSTIDIDHYHFWNGYTGADLTQPHVKIADGVNLTHVTFDGYQAWVLGKHGIYWNDTTSVAGSIALRVENVRWEQMTDATGYFFWIVTNAGLEQLLLKNCYGALNANCIKLRKVSYSSLANLQYIGPLVAIDADTTCTFIDFDNVSFNSAVATVTLTATQLSGRYRLGGNIVDFRPAPASGAGISQKWNPSASRGFSQLEPATFTVANGVTVKFAGTGMRGLVFIYADSARVSAVMAVNGATNTTRLLVASDAGWFGIAVGAANFNLYYDGGSGEYKLQNNTVSPETFYVVSMGAGDR